MQTTTKEYGGREGRLLSSLPPHFRLTEKPSDIMLSWLLAACAPIIPALCVYGFRAFVMAALGVLGAVLTEAVWCRAARREQTIGDFSALTTGVLCALLLPASAPIWLPFAASVFGIGIAKLTFGALGRSPFNAAAAGYCFAALSGATLLGSYNSALLSAEQREIFLALPERC
ncbi:MAG: RnfABCDGE type electron transport complex subunit D, partial [Clostridia bacterium]|nr:RnfABCDGE type electron transport complex subunit D [Clostridia bacterium]